MANHTEQPFGGCGCTSVSAIGDERRMAVWNRLSPRFQTRRQLLGNKHSIGCVSLEITQRCNLDCTLCYLSELSEDVLDLPIEEVYRRIDQILEIYGPTTGVQISGGDPTLRDEEELVAIVRYASSKGLFPALLTNGIKATRRLLIRLVDAGLKDVAFHVDTTQRLKKYKNEAELNELRMRYIERVRGLKVRVVFNTTLHSGNMHELPELVRFFVKNADVVGMCSFQLGADTGRGELREGLTVTPDHVRNMVNETLGVPLSFDAMDIGHSSCNRIGYSLVCNGNAYDLWDDAKVLEAVLCDVRFEDFELDPDRIARSVAGIAWKLTRQPRLFVLGMGFLVRRLWQMRRDLIAARGKIHKLSFMIHNFMDADNLDPERIQNCSFMVMTPTGPVSMCLHNSQRDQHITTPLTIQIQGVQTTFDPLKPDVRQRLAAEQQ
ncbi:MAG: radical SAM protein [Chlorobi bacterium CHB2]|nr:radical SAM protein [Chlorobi bacterium CHB2]